MKLSKLGAISAFAVLSAVSNFAAATPGGFDQGNNLVSYNDGAVIGSFSSGETLLTSAYDYTFSFNLLSTSAFTGVVDGWAGTTDMSGTLTGANLGTLNLSGTGNHLSFGAVSGDSSYVLHIFGTPPASGQSFNVNLSSVAAVPEPETFAMLLAGLGLIGMVARRRNKVSMA